jgi:hypothetical protein
MFQKYTVLELHYMEWDLGDQATGKELRAKRRTVKSRDLRALCSSVRTFLDLDSKQAITA